MKNLYFGLILIGSFFGCSTGPEFERNNENDPSSSIFIPDISNFTISLNPDKTVLLNWTDESKFEEGFIISKSFESDSNYVALDTISSNSTSYIDNSKELDAITYYKISGFQESNNKRNLVGIEQKLNFGEINNLTISSSGNRISLSLSDESSYKDKILVEKRTQNTSNWLVVDTLDINTIEYSFEDLSESYTIDVQVSNLLYNYNNEFQKTTTNTALSVDYNLPSNFEITVLNEAQIQVSFLDQSEFEDSFIIYERSTRAQCCNHPYTQYIALDTVTTNSTLFVSKTENAIREYSFQAYNQTSNHKSNRIEGETVNWISSPPVFDENAFSIVDESSIKLEWIDTNGSGLVSTYHYELELYNNLTNELILDTVLSNTISQFIFTNLDPEIEYEARVGTYTSHNTSRFKFSNKINLVEENEIDISPDNGVLDLEILSEQGKVIFSEYQTGTPGLQIFDLINQSYHTINDNAENHPDYSNGLIEDFTFSDDLDLIATNRSYHNDITGSKENWIFVVSGNNENPTFYKTKGTDEVYTDETRVLGFKSESELLFMTNNEDSGTIIYEWDFINDSKETTFSSNVNYYGDVIVDLESGIILLGGYQILSITDLNGTLLNEFNDADINGLVNTISPSNLPNTFNLSIFERFYRYDFSSNTIEIKISNSNLKSFFEISDSELLLTYFRNELSIRDFNTFTLLRRIRDSQFNLEFQNGSYIPGLDKVILQKDNNLKTYDLISTWVPID